MTYVAVPAGLRRLCKDKLERCATLRVKPPMLLYSSPDRIIALNERGAAPNDKLTDVRLVARAMADAPWTVHWGRAQQLQSVCVWGGYKWLACVIPSSPLC